MFTEKEIRQIEARGLTVEAVERQIENFRRGFPFLKIVRAASPADGVLTVDERRVAEAVARYEKAAAGLDIVKFVPASGAATRMFKELFAFVNEGKRGAGIDRLLEHIEEFAFWPELKAVPFRWPISAMWSTFGSVLLPTARAWISVPTRRRSIIPGPADIIP